MACSPPGSSVHGILQARKLEWVSIPFSRASYLPKDWTCVSHTAGRFLTIWATKEAHLTQSKSQSPNRQQATYYPSSLSYSSFTGPLFQHTSPIPASGPLRLFLLSPHFLQELIKKSPTRNSNMLQHGWNLTGIMLNEMNQTPSAQFHLPEVPRIVKIIIESEK